MKITFRILLTLFFGLVVIASLFTPRPAIAHIKNESSQFPDIEFSEARFDIVVLVGAGIIPETPVFEPDLPLSRSDLAVWAALFNNLGEGGETPDTVALAKMALEQKLVGSLEGQATYAEINDLFFQGQLQVEQPGATPTRAEAASYIASRLTDAAGGQLLIKRGLQVGPTGEVTLAESRSSEHEHEESSYFITVGGQTYAMYAHGRVANGPTDLIQWQGRAIKRSFVHTEGEQTFWVYLEAEPVKVAIVDISAQMAAETNPEAAVQTNHSLLYGLVAAVLVLGVIMFFRRKRAG